MEARYWSGLEDGELRCELCPHGCRLAEGQPGVCLVRVNHGGRMIAESYGRSTGLCVDPIEKKPLYHFLPGSAVLSFGTAGCNLGCKFCQNWQLSKRGNSGVVTTAAAPERIAATALQLGCASVAFTYNDPVVFHEYAVDTARACREVGLKSVAVTAGYVNPAPREEFYQVIDGVNVDLKGFSEKFYRRLTGGHLQPILDTLRYIKHSTAAWLEITTLLIPGENDSPAELESLTAWVAGELGPEVPIHFTAFHPDWKLRDKPRTPLATLVMARNIALKNGVCYPFIGNVSDPDGSNTRCHGCGKVVIMRTGWEIATWELTPGGSCRFCGEPCAGVWAGSPGNWGARRVPVRIED